MIGCNKPKEEGIGEKRYIEECGVEAVYLGKATNVKAIFKRYYTSDDLYRMNQDTNTVYLSYEVSNDEWNGSCEIWNHINKIFYAPCNLSQFYTESNPIKDGTEVCISGELYNYFGSRPVLNLFYYNYSLVVKEFKILE